MFVKYEQENLAQALIDFQNSDEIPVFIFVFKLNLCPILAAK